MGQTMAGVNFYPCLWQLQGQRMVIDDIGDVTITNDRATILKMLEVEHPSANIGFWWNLQNHRIKKLGMAQHQLLVLLRSC
ncbi:hypothetical protein SUGI_0634000 [Cryptomeria japonica]|nr:hypothetical protein SUGI_0634000 [Cryptomeria japonica]